MGNRLSVNGDDTSCPFTASSTGGEVVEFFSERGVLQSLGQFAVVLCGPGDAGVTREVLIGLVKSGCFATIVVGVYEVEELGVGSVDGTNVMVEEVDASNRDDLYSFARRVQEVHSDGIDLLVCGQTVTSLSQDVKRTAQNIERHLAVNFLASYWLCDALSKKLVGGGGRVLLLAAHSYSRPDWFDLNFFSRSYNAGLADGQSRTCSILLAQHLAKTGIQAVSVIPGVTQAEASRFRALGPLASMAIGNFFWKNDSQAAATVVYCALAPSAELAFGSTYSDCRVVNREAMKDFAVSERNIQVLIDYSRRLLPGGEESVDPETMFSKTRAAAKEVDEAEDTEEALLLEIDGEEDESRRRVLLEKLESVLIEEAMEVGTASLVVNETNAQGTVEADLAIEPAPKSLPSRDAATERKKLTGRLELVQQKIVAIRTAMDGDSSEESDEQRQEAEPVLTEIDSVPSTVDLPSRSDAPKTQSRSKKNKTRDRNSRHRSASEKMAISPDDKAPSRRRRKHGGSQRQKRHHSGGASSEKPLSRSRRRGAKTKRQDSKRSESGAKDDDVRPDSVDAQESTPPAPPPAPAPPFNPPQRETIERQAAEPPARFTGTVLRRNRGKLREVGEAPTQARRRKREEGRLGGTLMRNWGQAFANINQRRPISDAFGSDSDGESDSASGWSSSSRSIE